MLVKEPDNSNRFCKAESFFFSLKVAKKGKQRRERRQQMLHTYQMNHLTAVAQRTERTRHLADGACLSERPLEPRTRPAQRDRVRMCGRRGVAGGTEDANLGEKGWSALNTREAKRAEMAAEGKPAVNHRSWQRVRAGQRHSA